MKYRILWLALAIGCAGAGLTGCETLNWFGRKSSSSSDAMHSAATSDTESDDAPAGPKGFFKPTRLSGALSSEGAEIERHLGVH